MPACLIERRHDDRTISTEPDRVHAGWRCFDVRRAREPDARFGDTSITVALTCCCAPVGCAGLLVTRSQAGRTPVPDPAVING